MTIQLIRARRNDPNCCFSGGWLFARVAWDGRRLTATVSETCVGCFRARRRNAVIRGDEAFGGFGTTGPRALRRAFGVFGLPARLRAPSRATCEAAWPTLGLRVTVANYQSGRACDYVNEIPTAFTEATFTDRSWRTDRGLRVGDPVARLRRLYPRARYRRPRVASERGYWLVPRRNITVSPPQYPGLLARVSRGRVTALVVKAIGD